MYGGGGGQQAGSQQVGMGAAMQALKMFQGSSGQTGSSGGQNAFIGMAMGEASKVCHIDLNQELPLTVESYLISNLRKAMLPAEPARSLPFNQQLRWRSRCIWYVEYTPGFDKH